MAKVLGLKQLLQKRYVLLEGLPERFKESFGDLVDSFIMFIYGESGQGKSNLVMQVILILTNYGKVLYVGLEEGHEKSMQNLVLRHMDVEQHAGKIEFANHEMKYDELFAKLLKKKSPKFIVIDSLQYLGITYEQYKKLKERFGRKTFIFISHAKGKTPEGQTAFQVRHDAGLKIRVHGYIAFVISRYGGNKNYVIWEQGAKKYWGKEFKKHVSR